MTRLLNLFVLSGLAASAVYAQTIGASLQGTVTDPTGAVLPGATVVIKNSGTGVTIDALTDERGRYSEPLLQSGEYEIQVSLPSFQTVTRRGIRLTVGQSAVIDFKLDLGQSTSEVAVFADASPINLTSATLSGLVNDKEIRDLPLNGRSFQQLALLQPGVTAALAAGNDVVGGRTPKISINGARPEQNNFLLDGTDINNVYNKTPGSVAGVLLGVEGVLEFQVLTNAYSAEFGRSAGGVINAVTRSGNNSLHGSAFEFLRNSALDAKNFFDPLTKPIPAFKRNQFGATIGGPIRRDKTFFFGAYEGLIERLGITGVTSVPDENARQGILPGGRTVTLHPAIPAYLDTFFPLPNGRNLGGGAAEYLFSKTQPTNEHFAQGRVDHHFGSNESVFVRYTFDNGNVNRTSPAKPPIVYTQENSRNQYATIEHLHTFSPYVLNDLRFGINRSTQLADNVRTINIPPSLSWIPGEPFGYFTISGLVTEAAGDYRLPRLDRLNNISLSESLFVHRGRNTMKFGFQGQRIHFNQNTTSQRGGIVTFTNLESFLTGVAQNVDFAVPGQIDPVRGYRQWLFAFFAQDDVRLKSNLTLNLGLRYEFVTVPTEVNGKISNLRSINETKITVGSPWHNNPSLKNFAPRVGLAWDPFGSGRTSVRAGFGLFFDEILPKYYFFSGSLNPPFTTRTSLRMPPFPNVVANFDPSTVKPQLQTVNFELQTPYMIQYNLSVQRSLPGDVDLTIGYAGSRGVHLFRLGDANLAPETIVNGAKVYLPQLGRRNPNFEGVWQRVTDSDSFYNSVQLSAVKRFTHGLRAQASYTFSRTIDDASGINSQDFSNVIQYNLDWYDRTRDRGLSAFHAKHNLTFNWTYDLPFGKSLTGVAGALVKDWQLNNISTITSGHPFTVRMGYNHSGNLNTTSFSMHERPSVKAGASNNPILGGPDRYWDVNAFELPPPNQRGNLARNTLIGPNLRNFDVSLTKTFHLGEERLLQFRTEMFNVANHPNFAVPSGVVSFTNAASAVNPTWGRITSTVTTSRQIQFGLKLTY
jgi:outer membrane receptor protein involved in Fe transport